MRAGTRVEQVDAARAAVAQLDAALDDLACDLADCTLVAPYGGSIAERYVDEGAVVTPGTPAFRLVEDHLPGA